MNNEINNFISYKNKKETYSQLGQDLFVQYFLNKKRNGYFVEFGATDGISLNNTFLLEKKYEWKGILCEPSRFYFPQLLNNRKSIMDNRCILDVDNSYVDFIDTDARGLSTVLSYADSDSHSFSRIQGDIYKVETVKLDTILNQYEAPEVIDYMSIDTEGSELDILSSYSFSRHINIITVEHNYTEKREKIHNLLRKNKFIRIFEELSFFDDWYINQEFM
jgi:hypothetical protein